MRLFARMPTRAEADRTGPGDKIGIIPRTSQCLVQSGPSAIIAAQILPCQILVSGRPGKVRVMIEKSNELGIGQPAAASAAKKIQILGRRAVHPQGDVPYQQTILSYRQIEAMRI